MDKNTITGLVLMGAIFFLFMWLTPKNDEKAAKEAIEQAETKTKNSAGAAKTLSSDEREWLVKNIAENGEQVTLADSVKATRLSTPVLDLTLIGSDSISGSVKVDGKTYNWADVADSESKNLTLAERNKAIEAVLSASENVGRFGKFAKFTHGTDTVVKIENDVLALQLSAKSGSITRAELKKYDSEYSRDENAKVKNRVVIFDGDHNQLAFGLPLMQEVSTADLYFEPKVVNDSTVLMSLPFEGGAYWGVEYTLPKGDSYLIKMRIVQEGMRTVAQSNRRDLKVNWTQDIKRQEQGRMFEERNSGLYYKFAGGDVEHLSESKNDSEERQALVRWIGFKNQFFSSVLISNTPFNTADLNSTIIKGADYLKNVKADAVVADYDWSASNPASFTLFIGPNLYPMLADYDDTIIADEDMEMTRLIPLGWSFIRWINTGVVIPIFSFLGSFISNYGIIILLLTLFIKLVLFPLTYKSYKSQAKMRILAPDIKALNDKYPGTENAMKRQQETMKLYQKAGASPFSGCLPMLLQMPVLFAMFSFFPSAIELRGESFLWAHDLSAPDAIITWSGNIPFITEYFGNHLSLFCLLMTAVNIAYTYINMQNQPGQMPGMKWMMYLMPVFFLVFFNNYASGLSYYYFLTLLITIAQTYAFRFVIKEDKVRKAMAENAKKPRKKSGFMARLEEMQRQQQEMLRQQQAQKNGGKRR